MKGKWKARVYIDLFAGPGRCLIRGTDEEPDGSPLVALKCRVPFTHYVFNDADPAAVGALKARAKPFSSVSIQFFNKDANEVVNDILDYLNSLPRESTLCFCFVDPYNPRDIRFSSIARLTTSRRIDLAVTFHTGTIKRSAHQPSKELDEFFPDPGWQTEYETRKAQGGRVLGAYLLDCYKGGLATLGYTYTQDHVLMKNTKGVPLYHLIFASKHHLGKQFWDKVTRKSPSGQLRMF